MKRRKYRVFITLSQIYTIFILSILLSFGVFVWYIHLNHYLTYKQSSVSSVNEILNNDTMIIERHCIFSKKYVKEELEKLFNNPRYTYKEHTLVKPILGKTTFIIRLIEIDDTISVDDYTFALTHEFVHLTKITACERYCNFTAFKVLYESDNEYFKQVALDYAEKDFKGQILEQYSCAGYIEDYLRQRG